ncbi:ankyrin repeat domain-containing protein, partial [Candidatus Bathyarchaeota archaeon]|nr:ankyrin repeat domain-containing protein [Candidatus Bathyarchaeota archaeon]
MFCSSSPNTLLMRRTPTLCPAPAIASTTFDPILYRRHIREHSSWAILWAAQHDQVGTARKLLAAGTDLFDSTIEDLETLSPLAQDSEGSISPSGQNWEQTIKDLEQTITPLEKAAAHNSVGVTKLLLAAAHDDEHPDSHKDRGIQALKAVCRNGHIQALNLLLADSRVDPTALDSTDSVDSTALDIAVRYRHANIVKRLLQCKGVHPNSCGG